MTSALVTAAVIWVTLQLAALLLRYGLGVKHLGVGWLSVSLRTSAFNRLFHTLGRKHHSEFRQWFGLGVLVAAMLSISAAFILLQELWQAIQWANQASQIGSGSGGGWVMGLAVPGLTVPWSHAIYLWLATAVSICAHEAGHALAASAEGVGLNHMAAFTLLLLPGAYVALDTETLAVLNPWRTLRVVCGGVWHNAVLCMICWLAALLLPILLLPGYSTGQGAVVRSMHKSSPLAAHLRSADAITSVNQCAVQNAADWLGCLTRIPGAGLLNSGTGLLAGPSDYGSLTAELLDQLVNQPASQTGGGFCLPHTLQARAPSCESSAECGEGDLCFHEVEPRSQRLQEETLPGDVGLGWSSIFARHMAYGARRKALEGAPHNEEGNSTGRSLSAGRAMGKGLCASERRAAGFLMCGSSLGSAAGKCPSMTDCLAPRLPPGEELLKVCFKRGYNTNALPTEQEALEHSGKRHLESGVNGHLRRTLRQLSLPGGSEDPLYMGVDDACKEYLVFVGSRVNLLQAVEVTDYRPACWWIPMGLPHALEQLLAYTFAVSAALALLNMAPVYGLDGEAALKSLLQLSVHSDPFTRTPRTQIGRIWIRCVVLRLGTAIFALLLVLHVLRLTGYDSMLTRLLAAVRHLLKFSVRWG